MTDHHSPGFLGRLRVGPKITIIPLFFIAAVIAIVWFTVYTLQDRETEATLLEIVGRQRMLQQQYFAQTLLVSQGRLPVERLRYTGQVWTDTQLALINGGPVVERVGRPGMVTIPKAPTEALRNKLEDRLSLIKTSVAQGEALLKVSPTDPEYNRILTELIAVEAPMQEGGIEIAKGYTEHAKEKAQRLIRVEILIGLAVGLLGFAFSWLISRGITDPLQRVVASARNISKGNLRTEKLPTGSADEIGQLSESFNDMLDNLKELSGQILSVTGNVNSAAAEILASTQQQASSTKEQAATVQEITTTMQEISQSGAEIADKAKQVAASAEATTSVSNSGIAAVQNTSRLMEGIRQQVEEVATKIVSLSEKTQAIGEIVSTVNDLAEQSNLLALNASIEAASAGEQGSRFSVVANEMKNLAERAKESTVQVGSILGDIQKGINSSVLLAEEAVKRSESGKHQAEVTEKTIHQMMHTTVESINAFQQIIGATSQQQIGFDQVAQGMRDIRQAAEQTAVGTSQLEKALANLNDLSMQLRAAVGRYQI